MALEPRPLPQHTIEGLRPPLAGFPYFAHADRYSFQPAAADYSAVNAWWLADASFLVYGDAAFIEDALRQSPLPSQGFRVGWLGTADDNRGMVLSSDTALIIVFRGTRLQVHSVFDAAEIVLIHQGDLWTDSHFLPKAAHMGGRVHAGFLRAFLEICGELDAVVAARRPGQAVWLTGHSLGGALATLAAAHLGEATVEGLYTYGSPRVGDATFAENVPARSHFRLVHRDDWVPTVPPEILGNVHAGTLRKVPGSPPRQARDDTASGGKPSAAALVAWVKELTRKFGELPMHLPGLIDHAPVYYATLLWNALLDEEQDRQ